MPLLRPPHLMLLLVLVCSTPEVCAGKFIDTLPSTSTTPATFDPDSLIRLIKALPLHHIEGIWRFTSDGAEIAIIREQSRSMTDKATYYRIILLHSPNRALRAGTIIGHAVPLAKNFTYEAKLYTRCTGQKLHSPKRFKLSLDNEESRIAFEPLKGSLRVEWWRMLPYMWRNPLRKNEQRRTDSGCIRVFPQPELPLEPIYL